MIMCEWKMEQGMDKAKESLQMLAVYGAHLAP